MTAATRVQAIAETGFDLIRNPRFNKGSAFTEEERDQFHLHGLLPPAVSDLATQRARSYRVFQSKSSDLERYIYLRELQDSNETLFYSLLDAHITEMMPIVYTPTVGAGCQAYSHIYRRPRGIYLSYPHQDKIEEILSLKEFDEVEAIVVSDGERILGLGDQGVGGMGIPVGKLALYSACAGIHPSSTLPILLDTGTNNQALLEDPLYMGWRHERVRGQEYNDFIEAFVSAVKKRWPHVLLQWEDFAQQNANPLLAKYRDQLCTFNDDIQGTAAVAVGTLLAAVQSTGQSLKDQRFMVVGAGSAGCGISDLIAKAMMQEGLTSEEAHSRFYLIDSVGLLTQDNPNLQSYQKPFAQALKAIDSWDCEHPEGIVSAMEVMCHAKPTVLIGVSGQPGLFTEAMIREMSKGVKRPIIFPLSNPTSRAEATPVELLRWTEGQAIIGTGSPFPTVMVEGKERRIDQTNNAYIFPGMGLGIIAVKSTRVSDGMFMAAAQALAECSPSRLNPGGNLLPPLTEIREVSLKVALATAKQARKEGLCSGTYSDADLERLIKTKIWTPEYPKFFLKTHDAR